MNNKQSAIKSKCAPFILCVFVCEHESFVSPLDLIILLHAVTRPFYSNISMYRIGKYKLWIWFASRYDNLQFKLKLQLKQIETTTHEYPLFNRSNWLPWNGTNWRIHLQLLTSNATDSKWRKWRTDVEKKEEWNPKLYYILKEFKCSWCLMVMHTLIKCYLSAMFSHWRGPSTLDMYDTSLLSAA